MRKQWVFISFVGAVLLFFCYAMFGLLSLEEEKAPLSITVILSESSHGRWQAFREGLEMGAKEANAIINVVSTVRFSSFEEECALVSREASAQADALIVEPVGEDGSLLEEAAQGLPVMLAVSSLPGSPYPSLGVSPEKMGEALAEEMDQDRNEGEVKIALLSGNQNQTLQKEIRAALLSALSQRGLSPEWELDYKKLHSGGMLSLFMEAKGADVLFCLDNDATEAAASYLEKRDRSCLLYGVGRSENAISYLDMGLIKTLLVPDEYYMGYLCVKELSSQEAHESQEVDFFPARQDNMFSVPGDRILFPMAG